MLIRCQFNTTLIVPYGWLAPLFLRAVARSGAGAGQVSAVPACIVTALTRDLPIGAARNSGNDLYALSSREIVLLA